MSFRPSPRFAPWRKQQMSLPHGMEGHSDGSSAAPVNVIQWFCGQVTVRPLGSFPRYKSLGCGKVSRLPIVAKLEHCTAIFLCQPMDSTQTHPEWRITHTCRYLGNLMFQYWNEIYFNFVVIFWCKTTSFGPETLLPILTKWFPGLQQYKLWSVRVFLMFSSLNWHPKMLIQHQLLLFSFFFLPFLLKKELFPATSSTAKYCNCAVLFYASLHNARLYKGKLKKKPSILKLHILCAPYRS